MGREGEGVVCFDSHRELELSFIPYRMRRVRGRQGGARLSRRKSGLALPDLQTALVMLHLMGLAGRDRRSLGAKVSEKSVGD
ncbi:hypothetical protein CTI14_46460 [Methylobacterium radiotolerans]|nr:hypothetical protein CTI14_46460 [Methylobacterium radiotolerans]